MPYGYWLPIINASVTDQVLVGRYGIVKPWFSTSCLTVNGHYWRMRRGRKFAAKFSIFALYIPRPVSELWLYNLAKHDSIYHQHSLKYVINVQTKFCKNKSKSSRKDWSERTFLKFCVQRLIAPKVVKSFFWYFQCLIFWHLYTSLWIG